ncbi:ABC transporter substrate-binding protein [Halosimplex sp. J119]
MPSDGKPTDRAAERRRQVSRRHLLHASAMGGAAALAGCSNGGDGGDGEDGGGDGTSDGTAGGDFQPADNSFVEPDTIDLSNYQFNHLNLSNPFNHALQSDPLQRYHIGNEEYSSYAVEVDKFEGETAVLKVRDGLTWHNGDPGDPVNADDLYAKLATDAIIGDTISTLWDEINRAGDKSVELSLIGTVNEDLFMDSLNYYSLETPWRLYKDYIERWEDATTDTATASVRSDLRNDAFDEPKGNGPFQVKDISSDRIRMEKYEHHPDAENINWDYWDIERVSTDTASVIMGEQIDGMRNYTAPESVFNNAPDAFEYSQLPALWGHSLPFNHEDEDFGDIRVRQAIAEFIDREACANYYGQFGAAVQAPSGLVGNIDGQNKQTDRWSNKVSDEMAEQLHRYDNPKRGRRLLRDAGYQKDDGTWYKPNGDVFEVPIKVPAGYTDWHPVYETIVDNLKSEGIKAEMLTFEASSYWSDHYLAGDFKLASTGWTLQRSSPYYVFDMYYNIDTEFMNLSPETLEAPPVGELDGELQEVDVRGLMDELLTARGDKAIELRDKLAWFTNQSLPMLQIQEINDPVWFTTDDWEIPPTDSEKYQSKWPLFWFTRFGDLQAKPK